MAKARRESGEELLTLTEVSKRSGISMPTLQRYKKTYSDRIPSTGEGRRQRYPASAVAVFEQLKEENMARVGRPKKEGSTDAAATPSPARRGRGPARKKGKAKSATTRRRTGSTGRRRAARGGNAKQAAEGSVLADVVSTVKEKASEGLLTLTEVAARTGISYPTLMRYVKNHLERLPHQGSGRKRRFLPSAVEVFQKLRGESRGGRPPKSASAPRRRAAARGAAPPVFNELQKTLKRLESRLAAVEKQLKKPLKITIGR